MPEDTIVEKAPVKRSARREKGDLIKQVREMTNPDKLRIPKKNPMFNYRWIQHSAENISLMEAKGYRVATADEVRYTGLTPGIDGACHKGDLVLAVEPMKHHREHKEAEGELKKRQQEQVKRGLKRPSRAGGFDFTETQKED